MCVVHSLTSDKYICCGLLYQSVIKEQVMEIMAEEKEEMLKVQEDVEKAEEMEKVVHA